METEKVNAQAGTAVDAPGLYNSTAPPAPTNELGKDEFLQLLVAQLKYQDPLNPSSSEEFMATTAQFTVVEKLDELTKQGENSALVTSLTTASSLIGREVTANRNGVEVTAVVDQSQIVSGKVELVTKLGSIGLEQIVSVAAPPLAAPPAAIEPVAEVSKVSEPAEPAADTPADEAEPKVEEVTVVDDREAVVESSDGTAASAETVENPENGEPADEAAASVAEPSPTVESSPVETNDALRVEPDPKAPVVEEPPVATGTPVQPVETPDVAEVAVPAVAEPGVVEAEAAEPEVTDREVTQPAAVDPEATPPTVADPEVTQPIIATDEVTEPGTTEPDAEDLGAAPVVEAQPVLETEPAAQSQPVETLKQLN